MTMQTLRKTQPRRWRRSWRGLALLLAALLGGAWLQRPSELLQLADQILTEVSNLRGLEVRSSVEKGFKTADQIRESLKAMIEEEVGPERVESEGRLLARMGVIPPDYEYLRGVLDLLDEQVAGYYDAKAKTLFIASWLGAAQQKEALTHELVHALQDQYFDLQAMLDAVKDNDDQTLALKALVEGEAVALTIDHALQPHRRSFLNLPNLKNFLSKMMEEHESKSPAMQATPEFLQELFIFPYLHGVRFLQVYRRWHPWSDLEKVYADPPRSTEQILHPEKYAARRDDPTPLDRLQLPENLPAGWAIDYTNVLGEFSTYLWLKQFINEPNARKASSGWDGDAIQLLRHPDGGWGIAFASVWDDEMHAGQFFTALREMLQARYPAAQLSEESDQHELWLTDQVQIRFQRTGVRVEYWELDRAPIAKSLEN